MKNTLRSIWLMLLINVFLIAAVVVSFSFYSTGYNKQLYDENLHNIANLNRYSSNIAASYFKTRREKIDDITLYAQQHNMTVEQVIKYINESTSSVERSSIQLIDSSFEGFTAEKNPDGSFVSVSYTYGAYRSLQQIITDDGSSEISRTPEFTDNYSAVKSFALFSKIQLNDGSGGTAQYTLMLLTKVADIIDLINIGGDYSDMSSVLMDNNGDYILRSVDFKATNFFEYLYNYNGLSLDEQNEIKRIVTDTGKGELYYQDSRGRDCVFRYEQVPDENWFCVTVVPIESFHTSGYRTSIILVMALIMLIMLIVDVSWLMVLNRRLRVSMEKEQKANASKSEFLSRMSHDIRTPLNGIIGSTILALDEDKPEKVTEYLHLIKASGEFLIGLVNDILDMSKVESGKMTLSAEPYSLAAFKEYLNAIILPLATEKSIRFSASLAADDGTALMLDRLRFNQICFNLLSNAVKFTPSGGLVEFVLEKTPIDEHTALIELTFRDNGIGMSEEFQRHMFESFTQENQSAKTGSGTGLGLAIVKNLVELMGGELDYNSKENVGTTFKIRLKAEICAPAIEVSPEPEAATLLEMLSGKRVLLCEDNEMNTIIAVNILGKKGITVDTAENGAVGVKAFSESEPGYYDAILMDMMMPKLNGIDATKEIRALSHPDAQSIPIVAMTANAYQSDVEDCIAAGMTAHISKPIDPHLLFSTLGRVFAQRKDKNPN